MSKTRKNMGQICIILQKFITKKQKLMTRKIILQNYPHYVGLLGLVQKLLMIAYCLLKNMGQICIILQKFITKKKQKLMT